MSSGLAACVWFPPSPDLSVSGRYALCGKCHDRSLVLPGSGFSHQRQVGQIGASCSLCYTAHGMGAQSPGICRTCPENDR